MAQVQITYNDRVENDGATPEGIVGAAELNEVKQVVNLNATDAGARLTAVEAGKVAGPGSATDGAVALFDTATGQILKNSLMLIDGSGNVIGINDLLLGGFLTLTEGFAPGTPTAGTGVIYSKSSDSGLYWKDSAGVEHDLLNASSGSVVGPGSAVDENIALFDGVTGELIKDGLINKSAITANTAKVTNAAHTGEVTGATALTLNSVAITNKALVTAVGADHVLVAQASDAGNLKKVLVSDFLGSGTDADAVHVNVAAEITAITEKLSIAVGDELLIEDSEDANNKKSLKRSTLAQDIRNPQTGTLYILALTDASKTVSMDNPAANVLRIPLNSAVPFPIGTIVYPLQLGLGTTTISGDTGVAVNGVSAGSSTLSQFGGTAIMKTGTDAWDLILGASGGGDMEASTYDPGGVAADAFARANHTGTQIAATISDFAATVAANAAVVLNTAKLTNVSTNLSTTQTTTTVDVVSSDGTDATLPQAISGGNAGVMSGADKALVDGAEQASNKNVNNGYAPLDGSSLVPLANLPASVKTGSEYKGAYNASTNTPTIIDGTGANGDYYRVSVAGSQDYGSGSISFDAGDLVLYNGTTTVWEKVDGNPDLVTSVAGKQGVVTLVAADLTDFDTEVANNTAVALNTAKLTNVSTNLSFSRTATTLTVESSDGTNAILPEADTTNAGILGSDKWDEIVANTAKTSNATHTGDVTGSTALTIAADAVTYAKMQNVVSANRLLGNVGAAGSQVAEITAANVRTMLNVENGADVTDATNVNAAGAVMNSDTSTASMSFVIDEDDMISNSATKTPTQQSVKAYVDASGGGSYPPSTDTDYTTDRTIVAGDIGERVTLEDGATANSIFTLDVGLLLATEDFITFYNDDPDVRLEILVSNTSTMLIGSRTNLYLWKGESVTLTRYSATQALIQARG